MNRSIVAFTLKSKVPTDIVDVEIRCFSVYIRTTAGPKHYYPDD